MTDTADTQDSPLTEFPIDENELKRFNEEMVTSSLITPDKLYVDLALLKDFNIGVILSILYDRKPHMQVGEYAALYKQLIAELPKYAKRTCDDIEYLFPFLKINNTEFKERFTDPQYTSFILHNSPITRFQHVLTGQLLINTNHSAVVGKKTAINIDINTYPLKLTKYDEYIVGAFVSTLYSVNTTTQYMDLTKIDATHVSKYDEIYTYYLPELLAHQNIRHAYSSMKFIMKRLFVPRIFGKQHEKIQDPIKEELAVKTRMDIMTRLEFFDTEKCSAEIPVDISIKGTD